MIHSQTSPTIRTHCLTKSEQQVSKFVERGLSNKQIANKLGVKLCTVKFHITRLLRKNGAKSRAEFIALKRQADWTTDRKQPIRLFSSETFDNRYDIILAVKHNQQLMFKSARQFKLYMRINNPTFYNVLDTGSCKGYSVYTIKGANQRKRLHGKV